MRRAGLVGLTGGRFRERLDPAREGGQGICLRIVPEGLEQDPRPLELRQLDQLVLPELIEGRQLEPVAGGLLTRAVVEMAKPSHLVPAFRESFLEAEPR